MFLLKDFFWLDTCYGIAYKPSSLAFKLHDLAPTHFSSLVPELQRRELFPVFELAILIHTSAPLPMLFPLPRVPLSLLHLINSSVYDPPELSPHLLTPL